MKNYEIAAIINAFERLKNSDESGPLLPASVAWKRRLNLTKLIEANRVITEALDEVSNKYADDTHSYEDKEKGMRLVKQEFLADYAKARTEILEQETDVDIKKVKIDDIGDVVLSETDMDTLAFMIEE